MVQGDLEPLRLFVSHRSSVFPQRLSCEPGSERRAGELKKQE
jgi:hypothetical protein